MTETKDAIATLFDKIQAKKEDLIALRRAQPPLRVQDYELKRGDGSTVLLSELFGSHDELLLIHNMGQSCNYCMLWADGLNGLVDHIQRRCALVLSSPDEPSVMQAYADSRGWKFPLVSVGGSSFSKDVGFYVEGKGVYPGYSTFKKNADGTIDRVTFDYFGPGDDYCAIWPMFSLLPNGVNDWEPQR